LVEGICPLLGLSHGDLRRDKNLCIAKCSKFGPI